MGFFFVVAKLAWSKPIFGVSVWVTLRRLRNSLYPKIPSFIAFVLFMDMFILSNTFTTQDRVCKSVADGCDCFWATFMDQNFRHPWSPSYGATVNTNATMFAEAFSKKGPVECIDDKLVYPILPDLYNTTTGLTDFFANGGAASLSCFKFAPQVRTTLWHALCLTFKTIAQHPPLHTHPLPRYYH